MTIPDVTSTRDRLLEGACELFALYGFQAIGLRDLAVHVGISPGSLYHHIDSKQSLLYEVMEDAISELLYRTRLNLRRQIHASDRLNCFIDTFLTFKAHSASRILLLSREQANLTHEQAHQFNQLKNDYIQLLSDVINEQMISPSLPPSFMPLAVDAVIGMLFNHAQWLNIEVSDLQQNTVLKRFAQSIISTMTAAACVQEK